MRVLVTSAAAALLALPVGASAQSTSTQSTSTQSTGSPSAIPMDQNSAGTVGGRFHRVDPASQEQVRKSLEQAGFTNVRILDTAYLVQAQGANGETVMMMIDAAGAMASGSSGGTMGGTGSTTTGTGPGGSMGTATGTTTGGATTK